MCCLGVCARHTRSWLSVRVDHQQLAKPQLAKQNLTLANLCLACPFSHQCESLRYSLVDLMNLARTRMILGSGYSSYSEVASRMGGSRGWGLPIRMAGRDFGEIMIPLENKTLPGWKTRALKNHS